MATKNLLPLMLLCCWLNSHSQSLKPRSECLYEQEIVVNDGNSTTVRQKEKCVEEPEVNVSKLQIGNIVRGNQLLIHPVIKSDFVYKQTKCRWFAQADTAQKDLVQYQGIACEIQPNVWRIIDKF
jgi:hypothetical protein